MKKSLKGRITLLIFLFVIVLDTVSICMNYRNFISSSEQFNYSTANTVAKTCSLIIDKNLLNDYKKTNLRNSEYYTTWNKLIDYRNTNKDIVNLSVVWFDLSKCHYIFDTDLSEDGAFLGDMCTLDSAQAEKQKELAAGKDIGFIKYADRMEIYSPIISSSNVTIGYVIVGISTILAEKEQLNYLIRMIAVSFSLTFVLAFIFMCVLSKKIIKPINILAEAASSYAKAENDSKKTSILEKITIKTGDEIEHLFQSMKKMETDLLNSSNSLSIATWNSNHDSMTQLYNKRYLTDFMFEYTSEKSVAAYYFDVDNLKKMNDICGHENGDEVICKTAEFIKKFLPENGFAFRIGGDEFLMIICDISLKDAEILFARMQASDDKRLTPHNSKVFCRIAIGYEYTQKCENLDELVKKADKRMYLDKHSER